jgi:hypothetical protein
VEQRRKKHFFPEQSIKLSSGLVDEDPTSCQQVKKKSQSYSTQRSLNIWLLKPVNVKTTMFFFIVATLKQNYLYTAQGHPCY